MPETLTITVRDADWETLQKMAGQQWRSEQQQACALLEAALQAARAKANAPERTRSARRAPLPRPTNGVAVAH